MNFRNTGKYALKTTWDLLCILAGGVATLVVLPFLLAILVAGAAWITLCYTKESIFPGPTAWETFRDTYQIMRNRQAHMLEAGFPGRWPNATRREAFRLALRMTFGGKE